MLRRQSKPHTVALRAGQALSLGRTPDAALLAQLSAEYDPAALGHLPLPEAAGHAPLNLHLARRLADDPRLFLLPLHTPHLSWVIYGFFLHEGLGRSVDTYRLAVDCARRYRPFPVPAQVTTRALRALWRLQHRTKALEGVAVKELSTTLLHSLPALDAWRIRLWLIRSGKLRSESHVPAAPGSGERLLSIDSVLPALALRAGDQVIWAVVAPDNFERGHSLHGLNVETI